MTANLLSGHKYLLLCAIGFLATKNAFSREEPSILTVNHYFLIGAVLFLLDFPPFVQFYGHLIIDKSTDPFPRGTETS